MVYLSFVSLTINARCLAIWKANDLLLRLALQLRTFSS